MVISCLVRKHELDPFDVHRFVINECHGRSNRHQSAWRDLYIGRDDASDKRKILAVRCNAIACAATRGLRLPFLSAAWSTIYACYARLS
jgi:hypothetical protein